MKKMRKRIRGPALWTLQSGIGKLHVLLLIGVVSTVLIAIDCAERTAAKASLRTRRSNAEQPEIQRARMSDEISIHAAGQGNPWINLSDGHELVTPYSGPAELTQLLERNQARPLSLCSADFDEDGVPDLISGYAGPNGGIITLLRGNVDSIYPNAPEAKQRRADGTFTDAPFLSPAFVFGVPEATDFIGAGDFDGDGHWDVVAAARGSNKLYLMSGDGKGGLRETKRIDLPGGVTAMVVGEINRRDGLDDVVVGVSGKQGAKVLVFEGPEGALRASPEVFDLPAEPTSLALGQLDDGYEMDLAIAAGHELMIVHGRDRKLSLDAARRAEVLPPKISSRTFSSRVKSVALGDFTGSHKPEIALLTEDGKLSVLSATEVNESGKTSIQTVSEWKSQILTTSEWSEDVHLVCARVSSTPVDNILVVDSASRQMQIITAEHVMQSAEISSMTESDSDTLSISLEAADDAMAVLPMRLNIDALSDLVILTSEHNAPTATLTQAAMTFVVTSTNDSGPGSLRQAILDANTNSGADVITFSIPSSGIPTIRPLPSSPPSALPIITDTVTIDGTTQPAGRVELDGTLAGVGFQEGLSILARSCVVRGLVINRFASSAMGIRGGGNSIVEGNFLGTDVSGSVKMSNGGVGVVVGAGTPSSNNRIGGTASAARNVISGNRIDGIQMSDRGTSGNQVQGNYIGVDITGTLGLGNGFGQLNGRGVYITFFAAGNTVGGTTAGARNIISGNEGDGTVISTMGNLVQGNYVGTDKDGTVDLGNFQTGIEVTSSSDPGGGNVDSGSNTTIGGTTTAARNVISGNKTFGVIILSRPVTGNLVQGNFIGTDVTGTHSLGNKVGVGVTLAISNTIGGATAEARNVISGNSQFGVGIGLLFMDNIGGTGTVVQGNFIGVDANGISPLGNDLDGIFVEKDSLVHTIKENLIAFNSRDGVNIPDETSNPGTPGFRITISSNPIFSNGVLGIDLGPAGVTPNEPINPVLGKANERQNFPVLMSAGLSSLTVVPSPSLTPASVVTVSGSLHSIPSSTLAADFWFCTSPCSGSGHQFVGCVPSFLGTRTVTTNANGDATFIFQFELPGGAIGGYVNASATNPGGSTSEFSQCIQVGTPPPVISSACKGDGKQLVINGSGFGEDSKVFLESQGDPSGFGPEKTRFISSTQVIAFKAGKRTFTGDKLKVRNQSTGAESSEFFYTRMNCSP